MEECLRRHRGNHRIQLIVGSAVINFVFADTKCASVYMCVWVWVCAKQRRTKHDEPLILRFELVINKISIVISIMPESTTVRSISRNTHWVCPKWLDEDEKNERRIEMNFPEWCRNQRECQESIVVIVIGVANMFYPQRVMRQISEISYVGYVRCVFVNISVRRLNVVSRATAARLQRTKTFCNATILLTIMDGGFVHRWNRHDRKSVVIVFAESNGDWARLETNEWTFISNHFIVSNVRYVRCIAELRAALHVPDHVCPY